ncbi:MAG: hypothetical protein GEU74_12330 [Nitriliruptorales bacterium]|nr:hypothetical protein [Nitriliruptorales bacterium]
MNGINGTPHPRAGDWLKPGRGITPTSGGGSKKGGCLRFIAVPIAAALLAAVVRDRELQHV